jgi:hypothetical protein
MENIEVQLVRPPVLVTRAPVSQLGAGAVHYRAFTGGFAIVCVHLCLSNYCCDDRNYLVEKTIHHDQHIG